MKKLRGFLTKEEEIVLYANEYSDKKSCQKYNIIKKY